MKTTRLLFVVLALIISACEITVVEPRYDDRDQVVGSYRLEEYSQSWRVYSNFTINIRKVGTGYGSDEIRIENFYNAGITVMARVYGNSITIPLQYVNGYEVEGSASVYLNEISFTYRVRDTYTRSSPDYCQATAWF
ncbi:MAG: hypothetical protein BroJett042_30740 [Bacteroidota bacterium]|nr:MAG: hypothetical protein BroJett042_30740 [Bacteroidota bacterium]